MGRFIVERTQWPNPCTQNRGNKTMDASERSHREKRRMRAWRDKSPGLKILWIWTFATAVVLVTNVARTRMKDMDNLLRDESDSPPQPRPGDAHTVLLPTTPLDPGKSSS